MTFNKKILVLGNETAETDQLVSTLAQESDTQNYGLITSVDFDTSNFGYYHTTVIDLLPGEIAQISSNFDLVQLSNQSKESYPHYKSFVTTVRLMQDLEQDGVTVSYGDNESAKYLLYWKNLLKENKSFCFYPFLAHVETDLGNFICTKSTNIISKDVDIVNWHSNPDYVKVRQNMLEGKPNRLFCQDCYSREQQGLESARQYETLEWAERLSAKSIDDFVKITSPLYYEVWLNNTCNIMCRTCHDGYSNKIEKEWQAIGIPKTPNFHLNNTQYNKIDLDVVERVYWGGGEPTIMHEFHSFLERCISKGKTDFELTIGTNGMKFTKKLVELLDHFSNVNLSFSIDGYEKVNDYIRWKSKWNTIIDNSRMMRDRGHTISLQTVFSMWSISRMHETFEFFDQEFPDSGLLVQTGGGQNGYFMPFNHPMPELVVESMKRCQQTKKYYTNGRSIKTMIDSLLDHYTNPNYNVDINLLEKFYKFNDALDNSRNTRVGDYIPELEEGRKRYFK